MLQYVYEYTIYTDTNRYRYKIRLLSAICYLLSAICFLLQWYMYCYTCIRQAIRYQAVRPGTEWTRSVIVQEIELHAGLLDACNVFLFHFHYHYCHYIPLHNV